MFIAAARNENPPLSLEPWEWALAAIGAFGVGLSKTGIAGLGVLVVALFALVLPTRASVGVVLPILICADLFAVSLFRRHAVWAHLVRLFPWAAAGVVAGYFAMGRINDAQIEKLIGTLLLVLVVVHVARQRRADTRLDEEADTGRHGLAFVATMGVLGGFTTMIANAAGPIMVLYLLAMRLPKVAFIGTAAWYFLILNVFKVPFSVHLGLINADALWLDLTLFPFAIAGALCGKPVLKRIDQKLFENLALVLTLLAALRLLFKA